MSIGEEDVRRNEVVIVRRRSDEGEGGHHGGVWKIAYADFMTAMMAFFLVMWLVNASNKDVREQVARYFNPLRMTDEMTGAKGVQKIQPGTQPRSDAAVPDKSGGAPTESSAHGDAKGGKADTSDKATAFTSQDLFADPYGVLARIAAQAPKAPLGQGAATEKGKAFRDPFEPGFQRWNAEAPKPKVQPGDAGGAQKFAVAPPAGTVGQQKQEQQKAPRSWTPTVQKGSEAAADARPAPPQQGPADKDKPKADTKAHSDLAIWQEKVAGDIRRAVTQVGLAQGATNGPVVSVKVVPTGLLVSLTDNARYSMFGTGSAVPGPRVVKLIEGIAKVIRQVPGNIVISGHTDARPFRGGGYDNWRLSTDRGHAAYHMLVLGGVDPRRIVRVEGHADRRPIKGISTFAAENRRIEVLVQKGPRQ